MAVLATVMLLIWPVVVAVMFSRMERANAMVWSLVAGYLILPPVVMIDLPAMPGLDKAVIPAAAAGVMMFITRDKAKGLPKPPPMGALVVFLLVLNLISPVMTALTNPDPLLEGVTYRPEMTLSQGISDGILAGLHLLPFMMGYWLLWDIKGARLVMQTLITGVLAYSILMLMEVRFSPQMNVWVYGFFQHDFIQTIRYGGYRPIVFLQHPLWVAFLTMTAFVSAMVFARIQPTRRNLMIVAYLALIVFICKSAGALLAAIMAFPLVLIARPRLMVIFATILGVLVFVYPIMRSAAWMPLDQIVDLAMNTSPERGRSLEFRLMNEDMLLERAMERALFGWGGWGRPLHVDPISGRFASIPDGQWIVLVGLRGIVGYIAQFLLLLLPLLAILRSLPGPRGIEWGDAMLLGCLALLHGLNMLDLIPNATLTPLTWLVAGAIYGNAQRLKYGVASVGVNPEKIQMLPKKAGLQTLL